jgi:hypothetical protein
VREFGRTNHKSKHTVVVMMKKQNPSTLITLHPSFGTSISNTFLCPVSSPSRHCFVWSVCVTVPFVSGRITSFTLQRTHTTTTAASFQPSSTIRTHKKHTITVDDLHAIQQRLGMKDVRFVFICCL